MSLITYMISLSLVCLLSTTLDKIMYIEYLWQELSHTTTDLFHQLLNYEMIYLENIRTQ